MKIDQWCILAGCLILLVSLFWSLRDRYMRQLEYTRINYDQLVDSALEDGLERGRKVDADGTVYIDEQEAVEGFLESLKAGFDVEESTGAGKELLDSIGCIVILQEEHFTVVAKKQWSQYPYEIQLFGERMQVTLSDSPSPLREQIITECVEQQMEKAIKEAFSGKKVYRLLFPDTEEENAHTLRGLSMLCYMQFDTRQFAGKSYHRAVISGARVVDKS